MAASDPHATAFETEGAAARLNTPFTREVAVAGGRALAYFLALDAGSRADVLQHLVANDPVVAACVLYAAADRLEPKTLEWADRTSRTCGLRALGTVAGQTAPAVMLAAIRAVGLEPTEPASPPPAGWPRSSVWQKSSDPRTGRRLSDAP